MSSNYKTPLHIRALCLTMAGLTACTTTRVQNTWRDVSRASAISSGTQIVDRWGAEVEGPYALDPDISPGFLISIQSVPDTKLSGDYRVDFDGKLDLPMDKTINTNGMKLSDLKHKLVDLYRPVYKTPLSVDVKVKERRCWVDARGLVDKPGRYLVDQHGALDEVLSAAHGTNKSMPPQHVRIQKGSKIFDFDFNQYLNQGMDRPQILGWYGGETVSFMKDTAGGPGERLPVYVLGEMRKPGEYTLNPGSNFLDSFILAGGFTERADEDNIEILRQTAGHTRSYEFSWYELQHAPTPQPGDLIVVHADHTTKLERKSYLMIAFISALASAVTAAVITLSYNRGRI